MELNFSVDLAPEEGGGSAELIPGGRDIEVTPSNVYTYVRKYSEYRYVGIYLHLLFFNFSFDG